MKFLFGLLIACGLFAQTGIPYYVNGQITYLKPIGGVVIDVARKQIRTAINGGLRGTPDQLWSVNANGDGEAINVDWNVFELLPPGSNGRRVLSLKKQPSLSVIPSVKIISDREVLVCPECTPETPFVYRSHLLVSKITKPCRLIFPPDITTPGWVEIKALYGYNFFGSLYGMTANTMPNPTPTGHCQSLQVSDGGQGINYPDSRYPWFVPIAKVTFDGSKFTKVETTLTPFYTEDIRFDKSKLQSVDVGDYIRINVANYDLSPSHTTVIVNDTHVQTKEIKVDRSYVRTYPFWIFRNGLYQTRNIDYTLVYDNSNLYMTIKIPVGINISVGDIFTVVSVD